MVLVVLVVGGPFLYIHAFSSDAPPALTVQSGSGASSSTTAKATTSGTGATGAATGSAATGTAGTWKVTTGSQAGYRAKEVLFGQSTEAVGRTTAVTGSMTIAGTQVTAVDLEIDLTQVTSDKSQRDGQFQDRIMNTSKYPTATFKLTQPIDISSLPTDGSTGTVKATGDLTVHGTTKSVTVDLTAKQADGTVSVSGSVPVVFGDYGIDNPSGGPATVEDNGTIEFLVVLAQA